MVFSEFREAEMNDSVESFTASGHTLKFLFVLSDRFCFITPLILWVSGFCTILPNYDLIFNTYKIPNTYMCDFIEITQLTKTKRNVAHLISILH